MHAVSEPLAQSPEIARGELFFEGANLAVCRVEQLSSVHVAERVAREIANQTFRPVSVLKTSGPIVFRDDANVAPVQVGPRTRKIGCTEIAVEHGALELESDDDVQIVRHLIGLDADDARRNVIDHATKGVQRHVVKGLVKRGTDLWIEVPPET